MANLIGIVPGTLAKVEYPEEDMTERAIRRARTVLAVVHPHAAVEHLTAEFGRDLATLAVHAANILDSNQRIG